MERELYDYKDNVRMGNIDPSDGFHPTVLSLLDSYQQAPPDVRVDWLGEDSGERLIELGFLLAADCERSLVSLIDEHYEAARIENKALPCHATDCDGQKPHLTGRGMCRWQWANDDPNSNEVVPNAARYSAF
jgi:hypothetical protein